MGYSMSIPSTGLSRDERLADGALRPLAISIKTACKLSGLGATKIWELIKQGRLKVVRIDRRTLILFHSLQRLLEGANENPRRPGRGAARGSRIKGSDCPTAHASPRQLPPPPPRLRRLVAALHALATPMMTATRLRLVRGGYTPLPLFGKEPPVYGKNNSKKGSGTGRTSIRSRPKWSRCGSVHGRMR
jgi:hypothetical protein